MSDPIESTAISRREWLKRAATGTVGIGAGLAGCLGNGSGGSSTESEVGDNTNTTGGNGSGGSSTESEVGDNTNTTGGNGSGGSSTESEVGDNTNTTGDNQTGNNTKRNIVDRWWVEGNSGLNPGQIQWNGYNPKSNPTVRRPFLFDALGTYDPVNDKFIGILADEWRFDDNTFTITLRNQTWTNGDKVTAADVVTKLRLDKQFNHPLWKSLESVKAVDKKNVALHLVNNGDVNKDFIRYTLFQFQYRIDTPKSVYEKYLKNIQNAEDPDAKDKAKSKLVTWRWEDPISNGICKMGEKTSSSFSLPMREKGHPIAKENNFKGYKYKDTSTQEIIPALKNHKIDDGDIITTKAKLNSLPDSIRTNQYPWYNGVALYWNFKRDVFKYRGLRKAFAYLLNRKLSVRNVSPLVNKANKKIHGLTGSNANIPQTWLGDTYDGFNTYGYKKSKVTEAKKAMEADGFTKQNGKWIKPNGDPIKQIVVQGPGNWSWIRMLQTAGPAWKEFGLPVTIKGIAADIMHDKWAQGNFDIITDGMATYNPYPGLMHQQNYAKLIGLPGFSGPDANIPAEHKVPMPVGDPSGSKGTEVINIKDEMGKLGAAQEKEAKQIIRRVSWVTNQALPFLPVYEKIGFDGYDASEWNLPSNDSPAMQITYPDQAMPCLGKVDALPKSAQ